MSDKNATTMRSGLACNCYLVVRCPKHGRWSTRSEVERFAAVADAAQRYSDAEQATYDALTGGREAGYRRECHVAEADALDFLREALALLPERGEGPEEEQR